MELRGHWINPDEGTNYAASTAPSWAEFWREIAWNAHPPLFYLVERVAACAGRASTSSPRIAGLVALRSLPLRELPRLSLAFAPSLAGVGLLGALHARHLAGGDLEGAARIQYGEFLAGRSAP